MQNKIIGASQNGSLDRPLLGIGFMLLGMSIMPVLDICAKLLSDSMPVMQVTWARFFFHMVFLLVVLTFKKQPWWRMPTNPGMQVARGAMLLMATLSFFYAIKFNPIPNALSLLFVSPLVVTLVSPLILGEMFGLRRFIATVIGFAGVLIVLQPNSEAFTPSILFALISGFGYAAYILITRKLSADKTPLLTLFYTAVVGVFVLLPVMPAIWVQPDLKSWGLMALMGAVAALGHYMVILACQYAEASVVSPYNYFEIVGAVILSYIIFGYFPGLNVWIGVVIICASGIYISYRELIKNN
ncbi:MAG: drug/metabolite transporter (DMT)-like permease [Saprospiraceae bacterium]|jgi:drug/metabolite transporter (DMT)-like permease